VIDRVEPMKSCPEPSSLLGGGTSMPSHPIEILNFGRPSFEALHAVIAGINAL